MPFTYTSHVFTQFVGKLGSKSINMSTDTFQILALTGTYATLSAGLLAIKDTAATMTAVKAASGYAEATSGLGGSNYSFNANSATSGIRLTSPTWTQTGSVWMFDTTTNPTWTTAGAAFNPGFMLFLDSTPGTDATNIPMCWFDFGSAVIGSGGSYPVTLSASGILTITAG